MRIAGLLRLCFCHFFQIIHFICFFMHKGVDIYTLKAYSMHCQGELPQTNLIYIPAASDHIEPFQKNERKDENEKVRISAAGYAVGCKPGSLRFQDR